MANLFRCGGKPLITKELSFSFSDSSSGQENWYANKQTLTFDFPEKVIGVVSAVMTEKNKAGVEALGGFVTGTNTVQASIYYSKDSASSGTCKITAMGC